MDQHAIDRSILKRALRISAGMGMLLVGLAGWALPILPGWVFVIPGLMILGREFHWARRTLRWLKDRLPKDSAKA